MPLRSPIFQSREEPGRLAQVAREQRPARRRGDGSADALGSARVARSGRGCSGGAAEDGAPAVARDRSTSAGTPNGSARFDGRLRITAVDRATGKRVIFGAPGEPSASVAEAVLASCSVPWLFSPVEIGGREYVDGGVWSMSNLDAAPATRRAEVLALLPTFGRYAAEAPPPSCAPPARPRDSPSCRSSAPAASAPASSPRTPRSSQRWGRI